MVGRRALVGVAVLMRIRSIRPEFFTAARLDPADRQSFKAFGTAEPGAEYLYRLYDEDMTLLYVGITWNPFVRWTAHSKNHDWWGRVAHVDIHQCPDNRSARDWETWCIKHLDPIHNKHQKKGWKP